MTIEIASRRGYAFYQRSEPTAKAITLTNHTAATVVLNLGATNNHVSARAIIDRHDGSSGNVLRMPE
jgi:hypothetical protein